MASGERTYRAAIDVTDTASSHGLAFELIANEARGSPKRILDLGCAGGDLGVLLEQAGHRVVGVEPAPEAAAEAAAKLDEVFAGTLEQFCASGPADAKLFDVVLLGDVLEHLPDTVAALRLCRRLLAPEGCLVLSVPNVTHLAVRAMLAEGRWRSQPYGILDDSHLRFFDRFTLVRQLTRAEFVVERLEFVRRSAEDVSRQFGIPWSSTAREALGCLPRDPDADVVQFVALARPRALAQCTPTNLEALLPWRPRVLSLPPDPHGRLADLRLRGPLDAWAGRYGGIVRERPFRERCLADLLWADVVVLQREASPEALELARFVTATGTALVFELDDLLTDVPAFLIDAERLAEARPRTEELLALADALTVSTPRLGAQLERYNPRTYVVPTSVEPSGRRVAVHATDPRGTISLLIASSDSIRLDGLVPVLRALVGCQEPRFRILAVGPPAHALADHGIPAERHPVMDCARFRAWLGDQDDSVGLLPLDASIFSSCKSPIKYLDYALAGIPSVCSAVPPYSDVVVHGESGMLVTDDPEAWLSAIRALAGSPDLRTRMAASAREVCRRMSPPDHAAAAWENVLAWCLLGPQAVRARQEPPRFSALPFVPTGRVGALLRRSKLSRALALYRREGLRGLVRRVARLLR